MMQVQVPYLIEFADAKKFKKSLFFPKIIKKRAMEKNRVEFGQSAIKIQK